MRFVILILLVVLLASLASYAVLNVDERVDVHLPWQSLLGVHQIYLVLTALAAGATVVGLISVIDGTRLRLINRRLRREIDHLSSLDSSPAGESAAAGSSGRGGGPDHTARQPPADRPVIPASQRPPGGDDDTPYGV